MAERRKRINGQASREAILDAAADIAGERGFEGTSISLVSKRSGLPASSIYWHFDDKDDLIAAVMERSHRQWTEALEDTPQFDAHTDPLTVLVGVLRYSGEQIMKFPDFLRLGLMLVLEHRPEELAARRTFNDVRRINMNRIRRLYRSIFTELDDDQIERLTLLTLAGADGLLIAYDHDAVDLPSYFETLAYAVAGAARSMGWHGDVVSRTATARRR